jgi:uncharacterized protein (TIGR03382 family)
LALDSLGTVKGRVDDAAAFGVYTFTIEAGRDGSADSIASWALEVSEKGANRGGCGCASAPGAESLLLLLALLLRRRSRFGGTLAKPRNRMEKR